MNPGTGNRRIPAEPSAKLSVVPSDLISEAGTRGASAPQPHRSDPVFEILYAVQTLSRYEPGAKLTGSERGKINAAAKQIREAGFSVDDLRLAVTGWPGAMGDCRITALALAANLSRCLNAANGARARVEETEVERALRAMGEDR